MLKAAIERIAHIPNVKILGGDARHDLPEGPFDMIFLGKECGCRATFESMVRKSKNCSMAKTK